MLNSSLNKERANIAAKAAIRGFLHKNFLIKVVLIWVLYPVSMIVSCFMSGSHVFINFNEVFSSFGLSMFLTILMVVTIEIGKYFFADSAIDDAFDGVIAGTANEKALFVMKLAGAVLFFGGSIYLNISGAPIAAEHFKRSSAPPTLVSIDSINLRYDALVNAETQSLSQVSNMTWKGRITREGQAIAKQTAKNKEKLEENRAAEVALAVAANKKSMADWQQKLDHSGFWFTNFAGVFEIIQIICLFFIAVYNDGAKADIKKHGINPASTSNNPYESSSFSLNDIEEIVKQGIESARLSAAIASQSTNPIKEAKTIGFDINRYKHQGPIDNELQPVATDDYRQGVIDAQKSFRSLTPENKEAISMALKNANANRCAWESKLKSGKGKPDTNKKKIEYWNGVVATLEATYKSIS